VLSFEILAARGDVNNGTIVIKTIVRSEYFKITSYTGSLTLSRSHNAGVGWEEGEKISKEVLTRLVVENSNWDIFCIVWETFAKGFAKGQDCERMRYQG